MITTIFYYSIFLLHTLLNNDPVITVGEEVAVTQTASGCTYFTRDHQGKQVLCYTAGEKENAYLYFSTYNAVAKKFDPAICVKPSKGTGYHEESANKVAFRKDGSVVAFWGEKHPTAKNKFASSIYYSQSFDRGATWTARKRVHSDTVRDHSHSFFDVATLANGEVGAVWLDGRLGLGKDGSSLYFATTKGRAGFTTDKLIGETVCQCCRTTMEVDAQGTVHVIFRDIENTIKGQVRDFAYIHSRDHGNTFSTPKKVSDDQWKIEGCPHTGATLCAQGNTLCVAWFTAGGTPGTYFTNGSSSSFNKRKMISANARHPQLLTNDNFSFLIWDEAASGEPAKGELEACHGTERARGKVVMAAIANDLTESRIEKVIDNNGGTFPVIRFVNDRELIVAYTRDQRVYMKMVNIDPQLTKLD